MMISRKERKIQKALGLEDCLPPTMWWQVTYHVWLGRINVKNFFNETIWLWAAFKLPKKLVYWAVIRMWAHATTCPSGCNDSPDEVDVWAALKRWENGPNA